MASKRKASKEAKPQDGRKKSRSLGSSSSSGRQEGDDEGAGVWRDREEQDAAVGVSESDPTADHHVQWEWSADDDKVVTTRRGQYVTTPTPGKTRPKRRESQGGSVGDSGANSESRIRSPDEEEAAPSSSRRGRRSSAGSRSSPQTLGAPAVLAAAPAIISAAVAAQFPLGSEPVREQLAAAASADANSVLITRALEYNVPSPERERLAAAAAEEEAVALAAVSAESGAVEVSIPVWVRSMDVWFLILLVLLPISLGLFYHAGSMVRLVGGQAGLQAPLIVGPVGARGSGGSGGSGGRSSLTEVFSVETTTVSGGIDASSFEFSAREIAVSSMEETEAVEEAAEEVVGEEEEDANSVTATISASTDTQEQEAAEAGGEPTEEEEVQQEAQQQEEEQGEQQGEDVSTAEVVGGEGGGGAAISGAFSRAPRRHHLHNFAPPIEDASVSTVSTASADPDERDYAVGPRGGRVLRQAEYTSAPVQGRSAGLAAAGDERVLVSHLQVAPEQFYALPPAGKVTV
ncbi:hypothetical protein B484DRAFT_484125, partial [Ochromonadaceae sp. CCMP2298]